MDCHSSHPAYIKQNTAAQFLEKLQRYNTTRDTKKQHTEELKKSLTENNYPSNFIKKLFSTKTQQKELPLHKQSYI